MLVLKQDLDVSIEFRNKPIRKILCLLFVCTLAFASREQMQKIVNLLNQQMSELAKLQKVRETSKISLQAYDELLEVANETYSVLSEQCFEYDSEDPLFDECSRLETETMSQLELLDPANGGEPLPYTGEDMTFLAFAQDFVNHTSDGEEQTIIVLDGQEYTNIQARDADPFYDMGRELSGLQTLGEQATSNPNAVILDDRFDFKPKTVVAAEDMQAQIDAMSLNEISCFVVEFDDLGLDPEFLKLAVATLETYLFRKELPAETLIQVYCTLHDYYNKTGNYDRLAEFLYLNAPGDPFGCP